MATVQTFEDLLVWQKAREFAKRIFEVIQEGTFARDFALRDQINASNGSIMDNIAEGFERRGNKEFIQFLSYSKGSAGEARSQILRAFDRNHIDQATMIQLRDEVTLISKRISGLTSYLQRSGFRGSKFHEPKEFYKSSPPANQVGESSL